MTSTAHDPHYQTCIVEDIDSNLVRRSIRVFLSVFCNGRSFFVTTESYRTSPASKAIVIEPEVNPEVSRRISTRLDRSAASVFVLSVIYLPHEVSDFGLVLRQEFSSSLH